MTTKDLLDACVEHVTGTPPTGEWGKAGAPYQFETLADSRRRLTVTHAESGDRVGAVGATNAAAVEALADKLGVGQEA